MGLRQTPNPNVWKVAQPYDNLCSSLSKLELMDTKITLELLLYETRETLNSFTATDEYWDTFLEIARIHAMLAQVSCQVQLRKYDSPHQRYQNWYGQPESLDLKLRYDSWSLWSTLMKKHKQRYYKRFTGGESFLRLFASKIGNHSPPWDIMLSKMLTKYCPTHTFGLCWDPILGRWDRIYKQPVHLFPADQGAFMGEIFVGEDVGVTRLFSPRNGLFTSVAIRKALDKGYIAIVPDIDLQPIDSLYPFNNDELRKVKAWEKEAVKDYKVIVIDKQHQEVKVPLYKPGKGPNIRLLDLHNRKLKFRTTYRPRAQYIWWTFLNAILHVYWRGNLMDRHVQDELVKLARYWGRDGKYVFESQLLGIVQELGPEVGSLVKEGLGKSYGERPDFEAVSALVEAAAVKSVSDVESLEDIDLNDLDGLDGLDGSDGSDSDDDYLQLTVVWD